jgi:hypothetical protein
VELEVAIVSGSGEVDLDTYTTFQFVKSTANLRCGEERSSIRMRVTHRCCHQGEENHRYRIEEIEVDHPFGIRLLEERALDDSLDGGVGV